MSSAERPATFRRSDDQLAAFNEIAKALTSTLEVREVLALAMQKVSELLQPSHWSLLLHNERTGKLYFEVVVGEGAEVLKDVALEPTEGIAGAVFTSGEPRIVADVGMDPAFSRRFDQRTQFRTASVLAVPLKFKGKVLGIIELVNGIHASAFDDADLQVLAGIADYVAIAIVNARAYQRVQELTLEDEHTGLYNVRHLRALLEQEVVRAKRFSHSLSLLFLDLDHFKLVNDTHGHLVGSAVLKEAGEVLLSCCRQVDSAFRYGGDEFAVLLIETDIGGARRVGERIRDSFRAKRFQVEQGLSLMLTASIGAATFPDHAGTAMELVQASDQAMYRVKQSGRNEVKTADLVTSPSLVLRPPGS